MLHVRAVKLPFCHSTDSTASILRCFVEVCAIPKAVSMNMGHGSIYISKLPEIEPCHNK